MERTTMLSLVLALAERGLSAAAIERNAAELINSGQVILSGNFKGQRIPMAASERP